MNPLDLGGVPILGQRPERAIGMQITIALADGGLASAQLLIPHSLVTMPAMLPRELSEQFMTAVDQGFWQAFSSLAQVYNQSARKGDQDASGSTGLAAT